MASNNEIELANGVIGAFRLPRRDDDICPHCDASVEFDRPLDDDGLVECWNCKKPFDAREDEEKLAYAVLKLEERNIHLREALVEFGSHHFNCAIEHGGECSCGYAAAVLDD